MSEKKLSDSQFHMWRTLFAMAHADQVVSTEEVRFMAEALEDVAFSEAQHAILSEDIKHPKNVEEMFAGITDMRDQALFFKYAGSLVHIDGDYGDDEQKILLRLQKIHLKNANVDALVGAIDLEFEEDSAPVAPPVEAPKGFKEIVSSFSDRFKRRYSRS